MKGQQTVNESEGHSVDVRGRPPVNLPVDGLLASGSTFGDQHGRSTDIFASAKVAQRQFNGAYTWFTPKQKTITDLMTSINHCQGDCEN